MKKTTQRKLISLTIVLISFLLASSLTHAATKKKEVLAEGQEDQKMDPKEKKDNSRFPIGCRPVGYEQRLKVLTLFPGKEGALQSMYFVFNQLPQSVSLYQMRDKESEYSTRFNHTIRPNSWAVLATGERNLKFICTLGDGKTSYGQILDCADTVKVCEYVNVKFGLNNKGNFWIVDSNTRNGAVSEVVHYGIIPGV